MDKQDEGSGNVLHERHVMREEDLARALPGRRWEPVGGCYGKVHLVVDGVSLCGMRGEWFQSWAHPPSPTCKKCMSQGSRLTQCITGVAGEESKWNERKHGRQRPS